MVCCYFRLEFSLMTSYFCRFVAQPGVTWSWMLVVNLLHARLVQPPGKLCCAVECYRCQRTKLTDTVRSKQYCPPHDTMCSRARNKLSNQRQYLNSTAHSYHLVSRNAVDEFGSREIVLHLFPQCWYTTASTWQNHLQPARHLNNSLVFLPFQWLFPTEPGLDGHHRLLLQISKIWPDQI